jgi:lipoprotein-anchoring transpeptidase ErfK/SrfK
MRHLFLFLVAMLAPFGTAPALAKVAVTINLSTQTMHVRSKTGTYTWRVSTARSGYATPRGRYRPTLLKRMHYSRKYHMSPMPHSIFFNGGYAIHGTYETGKLGRPASHGCIRLSPRHAAHLYEMVKSEGATITIKDSRPSRVKQAKRTRMATPAAYPVEAGPVSARFLNLGWPPGAVQ